MVNMELQSIMIEKFEEELKEIGFERQNFGFNVEVEGKVICISAEVKQMGSQFALASQEKEDLESFNVIKGKIEFFIGGESPRFHVQAKRCFFPREGDSFESPAGRALVMKSFEIVKVLHKLHLIVKSNGMPDEGVTLKNLNDEAEKALAEIFLMEK